MQNDFLSLTFDQATGLLKSLTDLQTKDTISINQTFGFYAGSVGNNTKEDSRAAGAYISRPNCTKVEECFRVLSGNGTYEIVKGSIVQEVRQHINSWVSQVVRLSATSKHVEFEWQVGPIPIGDGIGKEIVSRFETNLQSEATFYTDSNGRQTIKRTRPLNKGEQLAPKNQRVNRLSTRFGSQVINRISVRVFVKLEALGDAERCQCCFTINAVDVRPQSMASADNQIVSVCSKETKEHFTVTNRGNQRLKLWCDTRVCTYHRNFRPTFNINLTEPVSSNYYPVVDRIFIRDESKKTQLTVLVDRPQGGSSLKTGQIELMVHRRLLVDDWLGVAEPLNETGFGEGLVVRGAHHLIFSPIATAARHHRMLSHGHYGHASVLFAPVSGLKVKRVVEKIPALHFRHRKELFYPSTASSDQVALVICGFDFWLITKTIDERRTILFEFSAARTQLPENLHLLSLEQWKGSSLILRLEHIFEKDEDEKLSKPVTIDVQAIVPNLRITNIREMTIDGNVPFDSVHRLKWHKKGQSGGAEVKSSPAYGSFTGDTTVTLNPMEIRTFQIEVS